MEKQLIMVDQFIMELSKTIENMGKELCIVSKEFIQETG
jgi:hypothetical protein